jgi:replicative DNA helicase
VEHYARIVRDKSVKRQLMGVCLSVLTMGEMDSGTAEEMVQDAQEGVYRLAEAVSTSVPVSVGEVAPARVELARKLARGEIEAVGLPMGWRELDVLTGGLHAGEVTMLAACTSVGKSSFAIDLSRRVSERGERVLFVSLEMSKANLADKVLACKAQVNSHAFRKAKFPLFTVDRVGSTPDERLTIAEQQLVGSTMMLWDETGVTPMRLRTRCRQMRAEGKLDLVVLDYVQLMEPDGKHRQQHEGYQEISRALKRLAGDLEIPILVCAQLNRSADKRDKNGKLIDPLLSEIGGSTSFEKDAHNVLFLSRDVSERQEITKVILAKSRMGETGTRRLMFNMAESRFCQVGSWES